MHEITIHFLRRRDFRGESFKEEKSCAITRRFVRRKIAFAFP